MQVKIARHVFEASADLNACRQNETSFTRAMDWKMYEATAAIARISMY